MKKALLSFSALFVFAGLQAQTTLTGADVNPSIGHTGTYYTSAYVSEGNSGANQTWNLSSMTNTGSITRTYSSSSVSGANIKESQVVSGSTSTVDMKVDNTGQTWYQVDGGGTTMTYSDPMVQLALPATYNTSSTDNFACTFVSGGMTFNRSGSITQTFDGYGTLTTPSGTFTNVSRVHLHQVYSDVSSGYQIDYDVHVYVWYKAGVVDELASVNTLTYTFSGQSQTSSSGSYMDATGLGITENEIGVLNAYPNPFNSAVNLSLSENGINSVLVTDVQGKIYTLDYSVQGDHIVLNTNDLLSGVYFIRAEYASGKVEAAKITKL